MTDAASMTRTVPSRRQRGMTLIELIVFIVVVSVGLAGVLSVFNVVVKSSADPLIAKQALAVAEAMLEEITLKSFCDPSTLDISTMPATCGAHETEGGVRESFDDVYDYQGYARTGIRHLRSDAEILPGLASYAVSVTLTPNTAPTTALDRYQIDVTVTDPSGQNISLTGYRYHYD